MNYPTTNIKPFFMKHGNRRIGKITLMAHQEDVVNFMRSPKKNEIRAAVLATPTGSGKTLAMILSILENNCSGIIAYPTRALIDDQKRSIMNLLEMMGYTPDIIEGMPPKTIRTCGKPVIQIITGEILAYLSRGKSRGKVLRDLINSITGPRRIILTTPDVIYLIFKGLYAGALRLREDLVRELFRILAIDEFHLYWGYSLINLYATVRLAKNILTGVILSTATMPDDAERFLKSSLALSSKDPRTPTIKIFETRDYIATEETGRKIRYKTKLELRTIDSMIYDEESAKIAAGEIMRLYDIHKHEQTPIKVVGIFNSIVGVENVYNELKQNLDAEVGVIHGLIPKSERKLTAPVIVGTSAIEVGVDFNAASIVFDGNDAGTIIQRFGRVGRHSPGHAVLLGTGNINLPGKEMSYMNFVQFIENNYIRQSQYTDILFHPPTEIKYILGSFAVSVVKNMISSRKIKKSEVEKQLQRVLELLIPKGSTGKKATSSIRLLGYMCKKALTDNNIQSAGTNTKVIQFLARAFFRDAGRAVLALYGPKRYPTTVGIKELSRFEYRLASEKEEIAYKDYTEMLGIKKVVIIDALKLKKEHKLQLLERNEGIVFIEERHLINVPPPMKDLIRGLPCIYLHSKPQDWRFSAIPVERGYILLGTDAIVYNAIRHAKNMESHCFVL